MVDSHIRGHRIYYDPEMTCWCYKSDGRVVDYEKPCVRCGQIPTPEGYDACLGYMLGVTGACCGHGVKKPYKVYGPVLHGFGLPYEEKGVSK